jgi:hypothetical protein
MVPVIASGGASFYGAFQYYFHDKKADTSHRVAWTETLNMLTDCVDKAWKVMAYTAKAQQRLKEASGQKMTGAKMKKPVFAYSLSWHPEQTPTKAQMLEAARDSLEALGLKEHQTMIAAHVDEPQPHVHLVVCKVHPLTGLVAKLKRTKRKLSDFALNYERKEGTMYCPKREENHAKREAGQTTKYGDPAIAKAWLNSHDGKGFKTELEKSGYRLAQGRKRVVVVTPQGKAVNPVRELVDVKAKVFNDRISDLKAIDLPTVDEVLSTPEKSKTSLNLRESFREKSGDIAELKAGYLNEQQSSQYDERFRMTSAHLRQKSAKAKELRKLYKMDERQAQISRLREQIDKGGFFQKILGIERLRTKKLEQLKESSREAKILYDSNMEILTIVQTSELNELDRKHRDARMELDERLEIWWPEKAAEKTRAENLVSKERRSARYDLDLGR